MAPVVEPPVVTGASPAPVREPEGTPAHHHGPAPHAWLGPVLVAAVAAGGCAWLVWHDPYDASEPNVQCPTKLLTGLDCPLCGGLRMVRSLLGGQWAAAAHANLLLLVAVPFLVYGWVRWLVASLTGRVWSVRLGRAAWVTLLVVVVAWTVVRNLPGFPLQPGP
jgi:hypothetical protein